MERRVAPRSLTALLALALVATATVGSAAAAGATITPGVASIVEGDAGSVFVDVPVTLSEAVGTVGTVDHRGDIWAIGVMLYELMTGRRPFMADHPQAVMYQVVNEDPKPLSEVMPSAPAGVWEVIARCLRKEPDERYQDAGEVRNDLRVILRRLEESGDVTRTSAEAIASSVNVALKSKPATRVGVRRSLSRVVSVVGVLALAGGLIWGGIKILRPAPGEALRVLVMPPEVEAATDTTTAALASSNVEVALMRGLVAKEGIVPVEYPVEAGEMLEAARIVAADEVVSVDLKDTGTEWLVSLRKLSGSDGTYSVGDRLHRAA